VPRAARWVCAQALHSTRIPTRIQCMAIAVAEVILHQWQVSPYCAKVRKMLRHKGIGFRAQNYHGLLASQAAKLSATGKLPVLDYDGQRIADSTAIATFSG